MTPPPEVTRWGLLFCVICWAVILFVWVKGC